MGQFWLVNLALFLMLGAVSCQLTLFGGPGTSLPNGQGSSADSGASTIQNGPGIAAAGSSGFSVGITKPAPLDFIPSLPFHGYNKCPPCPCDKAGLIDQVDNKLDNRFDNRFDNQRFGNQVDNQRFGNQVDNQRFDNQQRFQNNQFPRSVDDQAQSDASKQSAATATPAANPDHLDQTMLAIVTIMKQQGMTPQQMQQILAVMQQQQQQQSTGTATDKKPRSIDDQLSSSDGQKSSSGLSDTQPQSQQAQSTQQALPAGNVDDDPVSSGAKNPRAAPGMSMMAQDMMMANMLASQQPSTMPQGASSNMMHEQNGRPMMQPMQPASSDMSMSSSAVPIHSPRMNFLSGTL